jgi:hypothetical protein
MARRCAAHGQGFGLSWSLFRCLETCQEIAFFGVRFCCGLLLRSCAPLVVCLVPALVSETFRLFQTFRFRQFRQKRNEIKGVVDEESFFVLRKTVSASSFIARVDAVAPQRDHDPRKHAGESASEATALPSHCRAEQLVGLDPLSNRGDVGSR